MLKKSLFYTSFEAAYTPLKDEYPHTHRAELLAAENLTIDAQTAVGPSRNWGGRCTDCGWKGEHALLVSGRTEKGAKAHINLYDRLAIPVSADTVLSYFIFPDCHTQDVDFSYASHFMAVDLHFTDGSTLSSLRLAEQNGYPVNARAQGESCGLFTREWNLVRVSLAEAAGKVVDSIGITYDNPDSAGDILTYIDDIRIAEEETRLPESPADDILITRGCMNNWEKSRGLLIPAVCVPNPFNFWAPSTFTDRFFYDYQASAIAQFGSTHQSSFHLLDRGVLHFMPNVTAETADEASIGADARRSSFDHENEIAHAHEYSVTFDADTPAGGVTFSMTPTDHAAVMKIEFPEDAPCRNLIFDSVNTTGLVDIKGSIHFEGASFTAVVDYKYPPANLGATPMYFYSEFSIAPEKIERAEGKNHLSLLRFPKSAGTVTMKIASSNIDCETAKHHLALEVGNASYEEIRSRARTLWDDILNLVEVEGASETQRITLRSGFYRMYMYPVNYSENIGSAEDPHIVYTSPYRIKDDLPEIREGQLYTQNGFWDTYRTAWPAYALLTPDRDEKLLDGIIEHYRDAGWVGRWLNPGALNAMVGTSYDIVFADAAMKGVKFDMESAYAASIRSALCPAEGNYGRAGNDRAPFLGYTPNGVCWTMENALSDAAIANMAEKLGRRDDALYFRNRALNYINVFNRELDFFVQRNREGAFVADKTDFNPTNWDWGYVETNAWGTAFSVPQDPNGLAALYGGMEGLAKKLNDFFAAPAVHTRTNRTYQHEMFEAQDIRLGQYQHSNQPAHHILYMCNAAGMPHMTQKLTRDVLTRLYAGSEIGQGIYGDEDNGEQSAWYFLSALGFYPFFAGSDEYAITSPLFDRMTLHLPAGDLTVIAENNSRENVYIQSMTIDGVPYSSCFITHEKLISAVEIRFVMGNTPSSFGVGSKPLSLTAEGSTPSPMRDLLPGAAVTADTDISALTDDSLLTEWSGAGRIEITTVFDTAKRISLFTVACGKETSLAPDVIRLEALIDGSWQIIDERSHVEYPFSGMIKPFALKDPVSASSFRLTAEKEDGGEFSMSEIELIGR
ncbi:MAG: GH92 family glycosyl hydrolase [Clostridia bacterium]|nr:GH92 family glycosyl hydrolase [Clostridia bacterium]